MLVEDTIEIIKKMKGVVDVRLLSKEDIETLLKIESNRNNDIIPVINQGLNECMKREYCLVMLKTTEFRNPPQPTVILKTDKGRILGQELISPEDREKYSNRDDVYFLSNSFIVFKPKKKFIGGAAEKELFILPPIPFPELDGVAKISDTVSGTPSTMGDAYIKDKYGYPDDPHLATIVIAFSKKN